MGTVEKRDKHKKRRFVSPEEKLERELKDCMHCRFFWGHNNRCVNGTCCKPSKKKEQKFPTECVGCPYYQGKRGKATWLYIDEFHVLLNSEYSAKYLQQLWKKVRKQGGLCTGITQNVVDLLQNYTATTMLANSEFVALLKQANTDSSKMAEVIGVSEAQLRFVTNTASGMGLIKCGSVVIPFDNQISKDTDLYKLYNTNIHEIIEMKKHANEKC